MIPTFGALLKRLRKRLGMSQDDLAAAIGYSRSLVVALEGNHRLPDVQVVIDTYLPALGLQEEPFLAVQLVELAAKARGERPPPSFTIAHERQPVIAQEREEGVAYFPAPPAAILGRDHEIRRLCDRLLGHQGRLLTLVGPPGVGKTRLAQAVGAQLQTGYRDGACFVPLAAVSDPALVAPTLLAALRVHDGSSGKPPEARLIEYLRRKELLLVLDNFEQLLVAPSPAVALVADLLAACPGLHLLVTSRERLHLRSEQRYPVPPLALGAAVELFVERCRAVEGGFVLSDALRPTIEAICQQLDCLPLALELCAAQIDLFAPAQLLVRLQDRRLELLVDGPQDLPPRQRTLRAAIAHSYHLLDEEQRILFRSLGVFAGGCDLEAIAAVSAGDEGMAGRSLPAALHALIGKSLVRAETAPSGATRYLLFETVREYALEQVRAAGEEDALRQRHYAAYLQLFRSADSRLRGPDAAAWLARLAPEQDNLRAALRWALDAGRYTDMAWLVLAVGWYWSLTGHWQETGRWIGRLLPHREALDANLRLAILISLYPVWRPLEEFRPFDRYAAEVTGLLDVCSDKRLHAAAWHSAAIYSAYDFPKVGAALERAIACARAAADEPGLGPDFGVLSDRDFLLASHVCTYAQQLVAHGQFARAAPLLAESARLCAVRGSPYLMADSLRAAGRLALLQGDLAKAHALLHEAVSIARNFNHHEVLGHCQPLLALVTLYGGDAAQARRLLADSLRLCLDPNDPSLLARICTYSAETALWEGTLAEAEGWLAQSLAYHADPRLITIWQVERLLLAARLATAQGAYARAATLFGTAEGVRRQLDYELAGPARVLVDAALARVRGALEPALFAEAFRAGENLSPAEVFATILAPASAAAVRPVLLNFTLLQPTTSSQ